MIFSFFNKLLKSSLICGILALCASNYETYNHHRNFNRPCKLHPIIHLDVEFNGHLICKLPSIG